MIYYLTIKPKLYYYYKESIYLIHCNKQEDIAVSYKIIRDINNTDIILDNKNNSKFKYSLIFNLSNNKLIGILKNISNNKGIFFNEIIKRFLHNKHKPKPLIKNEIEIIIKVDKDEDIGKEIYFLANKYYDIKEHKYILCHERMKELDYYNPELYINNIKYKYNKCFKPKTKGEYLIKIIINFYLTDCSFMFSGCGNNL